MTNQVYLPCGTIIPISSTKNCLEYCNGLYIARFFSAYNSYPSNTSYKLWFISISESVNCFLLLKAPNRITHILFVALPLHIFFHSILPLKPVKTIPHPLAFCRALCLYDSPYAATLLSNVFLSLALLCLLSEI